MHGDRSMFDIAPIRVGGGSVSPIGQERINLYESLLDRLWPATAGQWEYIGADPKHVTVYSVDSGSFMAETFSAELSSAITSIEDPHTTRVLDLTQLGMVRGAVQAAAAAVLAGLAENPWDIVVLVDQFPRKREALYEVLENELAAKVTVVARDGSSSVPEINKATIVPTMQRLTADPLDEVRKKLLRIPGWYRRDYGEGVAYSRDFYDGRHCIAEIRTLILQYLARGSTDILIEYPSDTAWLHEAIGSVQNAAPGPLCGAADDADNLISAEYSRLTRAVNVLVVTPVVDSGATIRPLLNRIAANPNVDRVRALAVCSTHGRLPTWGSYSIDYDHRVDYFLRVEQEVVNYDDEACQVRTHGVPELAMPGKGHSFSSYEFWDLVSASGTKIEDNVPTYRPSVGIIPDIPKILRDFGPWVADRMMNLIVHEKQATVDELLLLAPDESGAQSLVEAIQDVFDVTVVLVPREPWLTSDDYSKLQDAEMTKELGWVSKLRSTHGARVVVCDEFTRTGGTLRRLGRVAHALGVSVTFGVVVVDMRETPRIHDGLNIRGLYYLPHGSVS
jgi:hypoxanthine phosphoribosyltransferase